MSGPATLFETRRLRVRALTAADVDGLLSVYGDRDAMRYVGDGTPLDRAGCEAWVGVTARNVATRGYGMCVVERKGTGDLVGFCGLVHPDDQPEAELKYALRRASWGQGYATEVARAMLAHGAARHGLREVIATVDEGHMASVAVLRKVGMVYRGRRHEDDGDDVLVYAWTAPDA